MQKSASSEIGYSQNERRISIPRIITHALFHIFSKRLNGNLRNIPIYMKCLKDKICDLIKKMEKLQI